MNNWTTLPLFTTVKVYNIGCDNIFIFQPLRDQILMARWRIIVAADTHGVVLWLGGPKALG
jgi:hypothetical protein